MYLDLSFRVMIEITSGSLEEQIIRLLEKTYPITILDLQKHLHASRAMIERVLQKFRVQGIIRLQPLPDTTYIRLLRTDFHFVGGKHKQKIMKRETQKKKQGETTSDDVMYV